MKPDTDYVIRANLMAGATVKTIVEQMLRSMEATIDQEPIEARGQLVMRMRWEPEWRRD